MLINQQIWFEKRVKTLLKVVVSPPLGAFIGWKDYIT